MKVLILNPSSFQTSNVIRDATYGCWCKGKRIGGALTPPLPLLSIATVLGEANHAVKLIDSQAERISLDDLKGLISRFDVAIVLTSVMTFGEDVQILAELKSANPKLKVIVYGSQPTFLPEESLQTEAIDVIIRYEAEFALRDLISALENIDEGWKKVPGIGYKENGKIVVNPAYPFIENLDELPFVDWDFLPRGAKYFNPLIRRYPYVTELTSRGCPFSCVYCMAPAFYGKRFRFRSVENILEGLRRHAQKGIKEIYFRDELFTISRLRTEQICQKILDSKLDLSWICSAKIGTVDKELLRLMKKAGCHTIKFGVESGSQEILDRVKKGITAEDTRQTFQWANELGVATHAHLMVGLPGETEDTLKTTAQFLREINPTTVDIGIMTLFPGTPIYEQVLKKYPGMKKENTLNLQTLHSRSFYADAICCLSNEAIEKWLKVMHRSFYLRPSYIFGCLKRIRNPRDLITILFAGINVLSFSLFGED